MTLNVPCTPYCSLIAAAAAAAAAFQILPSRKLPGSWVDREARSWTSAAADVAQAVMTWTWLPGAGLVLVSGTCIEIRWREGARKREEVRVFKTPSDERNGKRESKQRACTNMHACVHERTRKADRCTKR